MTILVAFWPLPLPRLWQPQHYLMWGLAAVSVIRTILGERQRNSFIGWWYKIGECGCWFSLSMLLGVGMTLSPHPPSIDIVLSDIKFRSINLSHSFEVVLYYTYVPPLGWIDNYAKIIQRKSDIKMWAPWYVYSYGTPGRDEPHLGLTWRQYLSSQAWRRSGWAHWSWPSPSETKQVAARSAIHRMKHPGPWGVRVAVLGFYACHSFS